MQFYNHFKIIIFRWIWESMLLEWVASLLSLMVDIALHLLSSEICLDGHGMGFSISLGTFDLPIMDAFVAPNTDSSLIVVE
ncbi:hypothetical protein VNO77_22279 [Canavalia gladiata]|uniref:Uncharacterized protein n=1 Tax=Canavalia gladiata TaxID=3824 RepID=A0AAN9L2A8_CANGL